MHRYLIRIVITVTSVSMFFASHIAFAQDYVLKEVLIMRNGKLKRLADEKLSDYVERRNNTGLVPIRLDGPVAVGDSITVKSGANVKLEQSRRELVWLNYDTTVRLRLDEPNGFQLVSGEAYVRSSGRFRIFGNRLRPIQTGTEFYFKVSADGNMELLYVFDGTVERQKTARHNNPCRRKRRSRRRISTYSSA